MDRRAFLALPFSAAAAPATRIQDRGYYFTFCRMPTLGYETWKRIFDGIALDGGNLVLLWIAGGFRSKKFPITWDYNREHKNVQQDFVRDLIDYAHTRGIRVLLGFTPFSYDGVNQYSLLRPDLKATQKNGMLARRAGIHCWGYALNPARDDAQRFMLDYIRELIFDFYPNADGLLIESSDYDICQGGDCAGRYYDLEFRFTRQISEEVWVRNKRAMIVVYPHYFSGAAVPGFSVTAARQPFDDRWTLFFTPHSAHLDSSLVRRAKTSLFWDSNVAMGSPLAVREGTRKAKAAGVTGYVSSMESFSFVPAYPEGGERRLVGRRLKPFGWDWLADGANPYEEPLAQVNRVAFQLYSREPDAPDAQFRQALGERVFGKREAPVDDLLFLHDCLYDGRTWWSASPLYHPAIFGERLEMGRLSFEQLHKFDERLRALPAVAKRLSASPHAASRNLASVANRIVGAWDDGSVRLLRDHLRR